MWELLFHILRLIVPSFHLLFSCLLIIAFHYQGLSIKSAAHISWHVYTIAHHHTFTASKSCCCCLFHYGWLPSFNAYMLLFCMCFFFLSISTSIVADIKHSYTFSFPTSHHIPSAIINIFTLFTSLSCLKWRESTIQVHSSARSRKW